MKEVFDNCFNDDKSVFSDRWNRLDYKDSSNAKSPSDSLAFLPSLEFALTTAVAVKDSVKPPREADDKTDSKDTPEQRLGKEASKAILAGDSGKLTTLIESAVKQIDNEGRKIDQFGTALEAQLKDKGFDVKFGGTGGVIGIHRHGAEHGLEINLLDKPTIKVDKRLQPYDWVTKLNSDAKPETVISDFAKRGKPGEAVLKDGKELAKMYDDAFEKKDFTKVHQELVRSVAHAHKNFGIEGVRELESRMNRAIDARNNGPVVVEDGNKLTIYNAKGLDNEETIKALEDGNLKEKGIFKHPRLGYVQTLQKGPTIELKKN